jgi:AraC family ethanolamine operon transcriptional activator
MPSPVWCARVHATDPGQLTEMAGDWNFNYAQLRKGDFRADGVLLQLGAVSVARALMRQTMLHKGHAPPGMMAVMIPGAGSGPAYANGQSVESGQCMTLSEGACIEMISHGLYLNISIGFDLNVYRARLESLRGGSFDIARGMTVAAPGPAWNAEMQARVEWIVASAAEYPQSTGDGRVQASLADHVLAAMVRFDSTPADVDSTTCSTHASRRVAVRLACEYIDSHLSEPMRLSELCRFARAKIRSLEYGFREVTGLTPIGYIRSLRLNAVRKALQHDTSVPLRSISEVAMDAGFWHLSQFATDYRLFFGETPTDTRRRLFGMHAASRTLNFVRHVRAVVDTSIPGLLQPAGP